MLIKVILLQIIVASMVLFVLKFILEYELLVYALEHIEGFGPAEGEDVKEVTILIGRTMSDKMMARFDRVIKTKFPNAGASIVISREIGGGVVIQIDGKILDFSLAGRLKHLWGQRPA
jgi:F0F1-type ATP synthase delta subunit